MSILVWAIVLSVPKAMREPENEIRQYVPHLFCCITVSKGTGCIKRITTNQTLRNNFCYYLLSSQLIFEQLILQIKLLIKNKKQYEKLFIGLSFIFSFILFSCNNIQSNQRVDDKEEQNKRQQKEEVRNNIAKYLVIEREEPSACWKRSKIEQQERECFSSYFF